MMRLVGYLVVLIVAVLMTLAGTPVALYANQHWAVSMHVSTFVLGMLVGSAIGFGVKFVMEKL